MIELFGKTKGLYDMLGDEKRLSILILLRAKGKLSLGYLQCYLGENPKEILRHLNMLEKGRLIQKSKDSCYFLTEEGIRRLSELGVTKSEAIELTKEREILTESSYQHKAASSEYPYIRRQTQGHLTDI